MTAMLPPITSAEALTPWQTRLTQELASFRQAEAVAREQGATTLRLPRQLPWAVERELTRAGYQVEHRVEDGPTLGNRAITVVSW